MHSSRFSFLFLLSSSLTLTLVIGDKTVSLLVRRHSLKYFEPMSNRPRKSSAIPDSRSDMPFLDKISRGGRAKRQEEKDDDNQPREDDEGIRKRQEYERQKREEEIALEKARFYERQELKREEEKRARADALNAALAKQREEALEKSKLEFEQKLKDLEATQERNKHEAQMRLAEERRAREEIEERLYHERQEREKARMARDARRKEAERKNHEEQMVIERRKIEQRKKLQEAEKRRQKDELNSYNSTKALHELRDLIRERYELDIEIWRMRNHSLANRDLVMKRMRKSDEILHHIRSRVEIWKPQLFAPEEWEKAEEVRERLLADGKRIWGENPPWKENEGRKGRPPPRGKRPAPGGPKRA